MEEQRTHTICSLRFSRCFQFRAFLSELCAVAAQVPGRTQWRQAGPRAGWRRSHGSLSTACPCAIQNHLRKQEFLLILTISENLGQGLCRGPQGLEKACGRVGKTASGPGRQCWGPEAGGDPVQQYTPRADPPGRWQWLWPRDAEARCVSVPEQGRPSDTRGLWLSPSPDMLSLIFSLSPLPLNY